VPAGPPETAPERILTGERTWPGIPEEMYWFSRHLACYEWVATKVAAQVPVGAMVLDAGAGEGYGAQAIAQRTSGCVFAADLDLPTVAHLGANYPDAVGVVANLIALPFRDRAFAAAVSLQVIEHMWDPRSYLRELDRCSRGPIVISTPNRPVHSPGLGPGEDPQNPFHVREFDSAELRALVETALSARPVALFGLHHGDRIQRWEGRHGSLASALLEEDARARDFAATVTAADFTIAPLTDDDATAQDLIALW